jgi:hypothetical protein
MPDITMCKGNDCPLKAECYRHVATPTPHWQSYFVIAPYDHKNGSCDHHVSCDERCHNKEG